ncbi:MAG: DUF3106 domain-containing protein [Gammaproteobacteria bacterium]|jgi:hypothetical protein
MFIDKTLATVAIGLIVLLGGSARADVDSFRLYLAERGDIPWQSLSPEEQDALRNQRRQWDKYSGQRQKDMQRGARRYLELPPDKRREVDQQRRQYQKMTPEQRRKLRDEYQRERR